MPLCCVDITVGARLVAVCGLVAASMVVAQLATDLVRGTADGYLSVLLGLSLDELDSRQRQSLHHGSHDHGVLGQHQHVSTLAPPFDPYVRDVLSGFLAFGVAYGAASALLAYASISLLRWGALPWLLLHALSITSQVARLIVQVAQYERFVAAPEHRSLYAHAKPMAPHPAHSDSEWLEQAMEERARQHELQHEADTERSALGHITITVIYLMASAYAWLVVLMAHRQWRSSAGRKAYRHRAGAAGPGDEGYSLAMAGVVPTKEPLP